MVQAINKIHSDNGIESTFDDRIYLYSSSGSTWLKSDIQLYKAFDRDLSTLSLTNFNVGDIIASYKTVGNYCNYSEDFNKSSWTKTNIVTNVDKSVYIPNTYNGVTKFETNNYAHELVPHLIEQQFYTKPLKLMVYSTFVKKITGSGTSNVALTIYSDTYGTGLCAKFDIDNDISQLAENEVKEISTLVIDKDYNENSNTSLSILSATTNNKAYIQKLIDDNDEVYCRIWLISNWPFYSQNSLRFNILDSNKNWKFSSAESEDHYLIYMNGTQLEYYDSLTITTPQEYIATKSTDPMILRVLKDLRIISGSSSSKYISSPLNNKLYYLDSVKEKVMYNSTTRKYYTVLTETDPEISNPSDGDISVISSVLSFNSKIRISIHPSPTTASVILTSTDATQVGNSIYVEEGNNVNCRVSYGNLNPVSFTIYTYDNVNKDITVNLYEKEEKNKIKTETSVNEDTELILGENSSSTDPVSTIYYDKVAGNYKLNTTNGYKPLSIVSEEIQKNAMVRAMTFNQGYFETWSQQGAHDFKHGYNTGGGYNFWKLHKISKTL